MSANIPRKPVDQVRELLKQAAAAEARLLKIEASIMALKVALCEQVCRTPDDVQPYLDRLGAHEARALAAKAVGPEATLELLQSLLEKVGPPKPDA